MALCPCGSGTEFDACCGPIIGGAPAPTAEALMRSRFTAYTRGEYGHIDRTHAAAIRGEHDQAETEAASKGVTWVDLTIVDTDKGGVDDDTGMVEFRARFRQGAPTTPLLTHHEKSVFRREDGNWVYVDGEMSPKGPPVRVTKVGRNDPCPCGSGKKFKKCCGA
jgi:SEC-C motif domain protein